MTKKIRFRLLPAVLAAGAVLSVIFCACDGEEDKDAVSITAERDDISAGDTETEEEELGDTFLGKTQKAGDAVSADNGSGDGEQTAKASDKADDGKVDLIFFMGQSNMSGAAGDASLAPFVPETAGEEYRAVSDPTRLYPITEPFGINENDPTGLYEYPGAKKGSLVSAFVNKYHELTGRRVVAVSVSMGATDMDKWMTQGVTEDVKRRFDRSVSYLTNNGYSIGHIFALWLHGESDAIKGTDPEVYRTNLDDIMRPLFIGGLQKVFIIAPGRTIDYRDIFLDIINMDKKICIESGYYAMATTILTKISTEYMTDQYHYNQHVLNLVGIESAKSVAYYAQNGVEKIVYDYREGGYIVPDGVDADSQEKEEPIDLSAIDINGSY